MIGKSKEDVKIWPREVSGLLKGNLVQRQMSLSIFKRVSIGFEIDPLSSNLFT